MRKGSNKVIHPRWFRDGVVLHLRGIGDGGDGEEGEGSVKGDGVGIRISLEV